MIDAPSLGLSDLDTADPASPCTKVCSIDRQTGWCRGCYRTGEEIGAWPAMSPEARHALLARLPERRRAVAGASRE
ncbi:MAG: DUF1289 domain-containing protein [Ferrovibrio sp.]|uniref:DUF1289 domain-containing protein n=1 Tax=Ferrovibrio sp. TaxID=1917215 RepID=UPI002607A48B|nr:DUF1289 domain-containing protein [Ferrovibrio sp.]MCW0236247.1 DUF1289 domain-containing protein [Ferrovibrio sp.]